jgi:4'-phosphopantetheinyl transferase
MTAREPGRKAALNPLLSPRAAAAGAVDVWGLNLDQPESPFEELESLLSADEIARASRFRFDRDRLRFIAARGLLRRVLARYCESDSAQLAFSYSPHGKPALQNNAHDIRFNLSHSDGLAVCAVTKDREIGIDLEKVRHDIEIEELAQRFFSGCEFEALSGLAPEQRIPAFYRIWTCKEAFVKAQGMGLSRPLSSFDMEANPALPAALLATRPDAAEASQWSVRALNVAPGFAAAVVVNGHVRQLEVLWSENGQC